MQYIDKHSVSAHAQQVQKLIDAFLGRCANSWPHDLYDALGNDKDPDVPNSVPTYKQVKNHLLAENNNRCCYCMRDIKSANTTLEHVIPNKVPDEQGFNEYKPFFADVDWRRLVFAKKFLQNPRWPNAAYPHTVAYMNLIPSCNGKFVNTSFSDSAICCNNKRGDAFIPPFLFSPENLGEIKYKSNGYVVWTVSSDITGEERKKLLMERKNYLDSLGLNHPLLVTIRRIWFFLASLHKSNSINEKDRSVLYLSEEFTLTTEESDMLNRFFIDHYWNLLSEFTYFNNVARFENV